MRPQGFPARLRIKQRRDFLRVQRGGSKHQLRHFIAFASPRKRDSAGPADPAEGPLPTRLGITVTRKIGNAVKRNRIKRLVRDVFRVQRERLPPGLDLVLVAKQQAADATHADVCADFDALIERGERLSAKPRRKSRPHKSGPKPGPKPGPKQTQHKR